jgi:hypothetical protein
LSKGIEITEEEQDLIADLPCFDWDECQRYAILSVHREGNEIYVRTVNIEKKITLSFFLKEFEDENLVCWIADLILRQVYEKK